MKKKTESIDGIDVELVHKIKDSVNWEKLLDL